MNRLKELRQEKKLSQKEIAETLGFSLRSFQRMENGESQIKPEKAQLLADYFGVSVANLLGYENNFIESVKNLSQKDGSDEVFFKAFRAYYELKTADGRENLLTLKDEDFLNKYREEILKNLIPNIKELSKQEIEKYLSDEKLLNEAKQKLNDFLFTIGTLNPQETQLLVDFIALSYKDKQIVLNILGSLNQKETHHDL
ncbi:XRE family transcriptional regulator [Streptococcus pneumoniae]|nr:XRE family transcriptional regulator [Streptococcus pneumoniae]VKW70956.1 XRE family transcriptional regulator [Streptococcus pneumoniae]VRH13193.1 XRE family transcriptional regulator [Streptococcus pneumoniae]HEV6819559.1 helix-turn-helix transcriptional regulator [Streptococcus pneumoniae]